ncbi:MAG: T9SS C-terminal target domain-containing protein, partial [Bacteroidota bacterium]
MKRILLLSCIVLTLNGFSQSFPYRIALDSIVVPELGGIHSFAFAEHQGKWLIVGGRLDGLHRRQPWASFDIAGHNNRLIVIDPVQRKKWSCGLTSLDSSIREQLSSTNMEFIERAGVLYLIG